MTENPVRWLEIYVQDMPRAKAFYESVLQIKLEKLDSAGMEMVFFPMQGEQPGASPQPAEPCTATSSRSANTASSRWSSTPKAT